MKGAIVSIIFIAMAIAGIISMRMGVFVPSMLWMILSAIPATALAWAFVRFAVNRPRLSRRSALYGKPDRVFQWVLLLPFAVAFSYIFFCFLVGSVLTLAFGQTYSRSAEISSMSYKKSGRRGGGGCVYVSAAIKRESGPLYVGQCLPKTYRAGMYTSYAVFSTSESIFGDIAILNR